VTSIDSLKIKIFADGADAPEMLEMYAKPFIKGLTTNPTLMRKAGISNYRAFAREILAQIRDKPLSLEVVCDEFAEMEHQAIEISGWADNVYVKIPVTNTRGEASYALIRRLASRGVKLNVTAIMTLVQVREVVSALSLEVASFVSVFAGRIADTGVDPVPLMAEAVRMLKTRPKAELIWASPREVLNIFHADSIGCHVVTATHDILRKLPLVGYNLEEYSLDTVRMFYRDAVAAGFSPCQ
jgi:transaldolase